MPDGRIIRILDTHRVVFNLGTEHGVERGMKFAIYTPTTEMVDPQTKEVLGTYRERKATLTASVVAPRYTIATAPRNTSFLHVLGMASGGTRSDPFTLPEPEALPIDAHQIDPMPTTSKIRLGDSVVPLQPVEREVPVIEDQDAVERAADAAEGEDESGS